ncbi:unnamed protein product [marine sediment metagenome]|uniref:Uncharacterized protein n=1 Tax=marine sediment metagenome TaxID=412755 RepID=X1EQB6_9ZZZZ
MVRGSLVNWLIGKYGSLVNWVICYWLLVIDDLEFTNLGLLALKAVLRCSLQICNLLAGYRLSADKHAGILTDIQTKVNKKSS